MNRISERADIVTCLGLALFILFPIGQAKGASGNESKILELAKKKFTLTQAEEELFKAVERGELADYSDKLGKKNDPNKAEDWDKDTRAIRAKVVAWLCTDKEASSMATHKGIWVKGARIEGELDLEYAEIVFPLIFINSVFTEVINLRQAEIRELLLIGTYTGPINGSNLEVKGNLYLREGFKAKGEVNLIGARIGGALDCIGGKFINPSEYALTANTANIGGSVYLRHATAEGEVNLVGTRIEGSLECDEGEFINKEAIALNANRANIGSSVYLREGFKAEGEVNLIGTTIGGIIVCNNGEFIDPNGTALNADNMVVKDSVYLGEGFKAKGGIDLTGATIGGTLNCSSGQFINKGAKALYAFGAKIDGSVFLRDGFKAEGEVYLIGATIGRDLDCQQGQFINKGAKALYAFGAKIDGSVLLRDGFKAEGEVNLLGATIGRDLDCRKGEFINKGEKALYAYGANIEGYVFLRDGFKAEGEVNLLGATIGRDLDCRKGEFINKGAKALYADSIDVKGNFFLRNRFHADGKVDLFGATIEKHFVWKDVNSPEKITLDLRSVRIGTLHDDDKSWPRPNRLLLHGLVYNEIDDDAQMETEKRIDWLRRQPDFRPQPYEQLADVLQKSGQEEDAKKILIAKNKDKARLSQLTWSERIWYLWLGPIIDYGYRPQKALWIMGTIIILGWIVFGISYYTGLITPDNESAYTEKDGGIEIPGEKKRKLSNVYPKFSYVMYSIDVFVPLIDLHQVKYWLPNVNRRCSPKKGFSLIGGIVRLYFWFHLTMGWALTTLLVVGLTGLIRT